MTELDALQLRVARLQRVVRIRSGRIRVSDQWTRRDKWLKRTPAREDRLLNLVRKGVQLGVAARQIGLSRQAVHYWKRRDRAFAVRLEEAQREGGWK